MHQIEEIVKRIYRTHNRTFLSRESAEAFAAEYERVLNSEEYAQERRAFAAAWEIWGSELAGPKPVESFMKVVDWGRKV